MSSRVPAEDQTPRVPARRLQSRHRRWQHFHSAGGIEARQEIANVKRWIDHAASWRAAIPFLRRGRRRQFQGPAKTLCIGAIEECCDTRAAKGFFLGLENHGGIVAEPDRCWKSSRVKSPWFGVKSDTGNFHTDTFTATLRKAAALCGQRFRSDRDSRGQKKEPPICRAHQKSCVDANYQATWRWSTRRRRPWKQCGRVKRFEEVARRIDEARESYFR